MSLARYGSQRPSAAPEDEPPPSAANAKDFRAHARHQPSFAPAYSTSRAQCKAPLGPYSNEVGQAGLRGRLRSRLSAKLPRVGRRRRELVFFAAEGCRDPYRTSQQCSQRRPIHGFEPRTLFGTKVATKKTPFQTDPLPMFERLRTLVKRYTLALSVA